MIADDVIERVRQAADIVQIIGEFVPLKRAGGDFRGPCPFHQGTKPNFSVSSKRGSYHCFVCHESGDVFSFVQKRLGLGWVDAVKMIGERAGIEVIDQPTRAHAPDPNEKNWEVLATAAEWFRTRLEDDTLGRDARAYLEQQRGMDSDACARFGIGYAPRDAQAMRKHLHALGFDDARLIDAGLIVQRDGESEYRARFINRIVFPIQDELGHHVAFGGRALGDATPKYLNSGESAVFQKRRTLYGLHTAKQAMRRAGRAIVVEGYLDAIRLALAGLEEVVAPLGTALTEEQAALLMRYSSEVFLLYDSDEAGQKATFRSGLELLRHKAVVRVVSLPGGEDPDTFVRRHGHAAMEQQLDNAIDLFDRQVQLLERRGWFADLRHRRRAIDKLLPTIRAARDLTRDLYLTRLADVSGLDKALLANEVDTPPLTGRGIARRTDDHAMMEAPLDENAPLSHEDADEQPAPYVKRPWTPKRGKLQAPEWKATTIPPRPRRDETVERGLVRAMLADRALVERVAERHAPSDFRDENYRAIFAALLAAGHDDALDSIAASLPYSVVPVLQDLTEGSEVLPIEAADVTLSMARLDARRLEARIDEIKTHMPRVPRAEQDAMLRELHELQTELRILLPVRSTRPKPKR